MRPSQCADASPAFEDVQARLEHAHASLATWRDLRTQAARETNARSQGFLDELPAFARQACG
jgi:hypothetical protein